MKSNDPFTKIGDCDIHETAEIYSGSIIGKPYRKFLDGTRDTLEKTFIGPNSYIGCYSIVGNGSIVSANVIIDDYCLIESRVQIGNSTIVTHRAQICNDATVGKNCVIGGFVGERAIIGDRCRVFGKIIHRQSNPLLGWDDDEAMESAPEIGNYVFIGFNALIIGGVKIGDKAYVCAGAIVTRDVPEFYIASEKNNFIPYSNWPGSLKKSEFFCEGK